MPPTATTTGTHNANGNQAPNGVSITRPVGGVTYTLTYDADRGAQRSIPAGKNRLVSVSGSGMTASFVYDGDGNRVQSTINGVTTVYIGNYYEKSGDNITKYYYAGAMRVAMKSSSGTTWLLGDHLGSTSLAVNGATGQESSEQRYKPFGEMYYSSGTLPTRYTFTGQYSYTITTSEIGLMYYGARWYDVSLGRFAQADTIIPQPGNPQSWDRYAYVNNSPLMYTDPSGHWATNDRKYLFDTADVWNVPISYYGVTLSSGWTVEDRAQIASELQQMANTLSSYCPNGACSKLQPHEIFQKVFGNTSIKLLRDNEGIGCAASAGIECSQGTAGTLIDPERNGLIIHEYGHVFDHSINGWGYGRTVLKNSQASNSKGYEVFGTFNGQYVRTNLGYRSPTFPDLQHPLNMEPGGKSAGEDLADMFMNFSRNSFAKGQEGRLRWNWMASHMTYWMDMISQGW